jgi:PAS domain S-box-containing protein
MEIMDEQKYNTIKDDKKTKKQLIEELKELRHHIIELEAQGKQSLEKSFREDERLHMLFEYAPDGFYLTDLKGTFLDGNKAAQELVQYKKEELIGKNFLKLDLLSPKQIPKAASLLAKNALGMPTGPDEFILNRSDGTQVPVEIRTFPIKLKGKTIVLGIARDITVRKNREEELKDSADKFRELADLLPQSVFELNSEGLVTYCNRTGLKTFGYTHKDIEQGIPASEFFIPKDRARIKQNIQKRLHGIEFHDHEYIALRKDGSTFHIRVYSAPIVRNNVAFGIRGILLDITEQKLAEEKIRIAQEDLELKVHERTAELQKLNKALLADIAERTLIEEAMKESEEKYRALFEESKDVIYMSTPQGKFIDINPAGVDLLGYASKDELFQIDITRDLYVLPSTRKTFQRMLADTGYVKDFEVEFKKKNGTHVTVLLTSTAVREKDGTIKAYRGIMKDITERKRLEQQLIQAQKMEAIGQLAGGIAHDFNNILTAIIGYGNLLKTEVSHDKLLSSYATNILNSAERAASLTHNLLAFSRKQMINPSPSYIDTIINGLKAFLPRLIGEDIELSISVSQRELTVIVDSSQIEHVLMNLATNARDAMPDGGHLTITTDQVVLDNEFIKAHGYGKIGTYALISVDDTGHGMDDETKGRLFDPFFTTKEVGKGTGLGLSMVYGIIKQHNGYIDVQSELGKGSTFNIYLPLVNAPVKDKKPEGLPVLKGGTETILIAEDDQYVRDFLKEVLIEYGYTVLEASDGEEALQVFNYHKDKIHLLILDVVMPKKDGKETYHEIKTIRQDMKAIFMSGYAADILYKKGIIEEEVNFISKPISPDELLKMVSQVLDR